MRLSTRYALTLVELLIALALSLFLLLGVAELFQRVGGAMNETRSVMSTSTRMNEAALLLRQDLTRIPGSLATKPKRIDDGEDVSDADGYLEIIEGPNKFSEDIGDPGHPYVNENGDPDHTVGDVDDIICFTTKLNSGMPPFRGVVRGKIEERESAEISWFVRGNTLYRRIRLIDNEILETNVHAQNDIEELNPNDNVSGIFPPAEEGKYLYVLKDNTTDGGKQRYDVVKNSDGNWVWVTLLQHDDLARRARRFGHDGLLSNVFPHPLYDGTNAGWYYLRMPTIEETDYWRKNDTMFWKTETSHLLVPEARNKNPDQWNQPYFFPHLQDRKSGSLKACVTEPRSLQAGEDIVLTNVLSFDVQVWDSLTEKFVDLGTTGTVWDHMNNHQQELEGVWDSWTKKYKDKLDPAPPYSAPLTAIRITIRCFDPSSHIIKQVTVVHRFAGE